MFILVRGSQSSETRPFILKREAPAAQKRPKAPRKVQEVISQVIPEPFIPQPQQLEIVQPEPAITEEKPRGFLNREGQLKRFINSCKASGKHWLWTASAWAGGEPKFSVDGRPLPVKEAAYCLHNALDRIPDGYRPYAQCHKYNCVSKDCLILVPDDTVRRLRKVEEIDLQEILRLRSLGNSDEQIANIIEKFDPGTVRKCIQKHA